MEPRKEQKSRFRIDKLEERIAPGTLTIRPPAGFQNLDGEGVLPDSPMRGLSTAEAHSNGVITWTPSS